MAECCYVESHYGKCHYDECHYAECHHADSVAILTSFDRAGKLHSPSIASMLPQCFQNVLANFAKSTSYAHKMLLKLSQGANTLAYLSGKSVTRKKVL